MQKTTETIVDSATGARDARRRLDGWRRLGSDMATGVRAAAHSAAPVLLRLFARLGDWLASVGWAKFFLVALLLLALGGLVGSVVFERGPAVVVERAAPAEPVKVTIAVSEKGLTIAPSRRDGATTQSPPTEPRVAIDDRGVRIATDRDGRKVVVSVDGRGVRIEEGAHVDADSAGPAPTVVLPAEVVADPERVEQALEAARAKIEEIVGDQVARQVARRTRVYQERSSDWLMSFVMLLIVTGVIVKVVLGSKKKAESRAQAATATAAEEGLKRQLAEAQLKMMQAQVEPHFLFNTLASVDFLIETDPPRASRMQKNLIAYLRSALPQMREGSTRLGKEVELCRAYLEILKVRMDERLNYAINVPQGLLSAQFPPMILQSLVENAIKHGLEPKAEGGSLTITADVANGNLRVAVADTGLGFGAGSRPGTGVGLTNVRERLAALYGGRATLTVDVNTPTGTIVTIEVPYAVDVSAAVAPHASSAQPA
jgi:signal transduction histidine kinase